MVLPSLCSHWTSRLFALRWTLAILWKTCEMNSLCYHIICSERGKPKMLIAKGKGAFSGQSWWYLWILTGLETKQRKEIECLMGCKLSQMFFSKTKSCQRMGSREPLLCCVMVFGLWEVTCSSSVIDCALGEALMNKPRNFSQLGREEKTE